MTASSPSPSFISSSILNIPNSKTQSFIINPNPFPQVKISKSRTPQRHLLSKSVTFDNPTTVSSSLNLDDEKSTAAEATGKIGSRVRVRVPLKVYHVPKVPELDLNGKIGILKQYVGIHKGKQISANLPYKVEFVVDGLEGRTGPVKFFAHLKEDEFEFLID